MPNLDDIVWERFEELRDLDLRENEGNEFQAREILREVPLRRFVLASANMTRAEVTDLRSIISTTRLAGTTHVTPAGEGTQVEVEIEQQQIDPDRTQGDTWSARLQVAVVL